MLYCIEYFKILMTYLQPVVPDLATKTSDFCKINYSGVKWDSIMHGHPVNKFKPMLKRIEARANCIYC